MRVRNKNILFLDFLVFFFFIFFFSVLRFGWELYFKITFYIGAIDDSSFPACKMFSTTAWMTSVSFATAEMKLKRLGRPRFYFIE